MDGVFIGYDYIASDSNRLGSALCPRQRTEATSFSLHLSYPIVSDTIKLTRFVVLSRPLALAGSSPFTVPRHCQNL